MTLWPFQQVVCHRIPYTRIFVAPRCSFAYCIWVLGAICLVTIPLFATFATDNVWMKEGFYREQPAITFTHDLFVVAARNSPEDALGWSTRRELESLLPPEVRVPVVRSSQEDRNRDGIADTLKLTLDLPMNSTANGYRSLLLLAAYDVQLSGKVSEKFGGLLSVDANSPYLASGVWIHGQLAFRQKMPLRQDSEVGKETQNPLVIDWSSNWAPEHQPLTVPSLLARYAERNETIHLEHRVPPVWDYTPQRDFRVQVTIDIPPQLIYYVPRASEVLKLGWMQVLAFLLPTWLALEYLKGLAFDNQLVESYVVPQLPAKQD
eukprot:TRINITY_DN26516_c0_g1_i1.p1 TRINITY_DN26516_c0_g1~~TRINITY_DN26516_c0_g1_i1.p1  ORF type:complete len:320 (-),score=57.82 TRINITY_DN26516_c0_g1_i1:64-1023(-)